VSNKARGDVSGRQKIRFVMLEADLSDGNLSDLTTAITNALRPTVVASTRSLPAGPQRSRSTSNESSAGQQLEFENVEDDEPEFEEVAAPPRAPRPSSPKAPSVPKYLDGLLTKEEGDALRDSVAKNPPKSDARRYLVATAWLRDAKGETSVNPDKIYTVYKTANWPLGISDWGVTLRGHVQSHKMKRVGRGQYALTPLGEADLQKADTE
jgi:hypothetical protein